MKDLEKPVIVSPDAGGVARAKLFMEGFARLPSPPEVSLAVILKQRAEAGVVGSMHLVGEVAGRDCIIVDDMIDTAGTLTKAADEIKAFGASRVFAFATHGVSIFVHVVCCLGVLFRPRRKHRRSTMCGSMCWC